MDLDNQAPSKLTSQSKTVVFLLRNSQPLGAIALADIVRPESRAAVAKLKAMGLQCMMLTGDNRSVAKAVADELGLDDYFAEVLPADKADKIREVKARGLTVAMVGDGVNDAPALVARTWASPWARAPTWRSSPPTWCWCAAIRGT